MMRLLPVAAVALATALAPLAAQTVDLVEPPRHSLVRVHPVSSEELALLRRLDVDHMHADGDGLLVPLTHADLATLRERGVRVEVVVAELEEHFARRAAEDRERMGTASPLPSAASLKNFTTGSIAGFYALDELDEQLIRMSERYPRLASVPEQIGTTHQGRPIVAVRLSSRPVSDGSVPEALFTAMHHAREPAGMMSLVYSMWALLEGYGTDPEATYLLDNRALWFIPLVNPDGYAINVSRPQGGGMWRKNLRDNGNGTFGVDLNRNYGPRELWDHSAGGSDTRPTEETYRGPDPFSEPETQAIRDFVQQRRFSVALNHHTFSNLFIQPEELLDLGDADSVYYKIATRALASLAGFAPGNDRVAVGYTTRGSSDDWMFVEGRSDGGRMYSWTPESGNGVDNFWPVPSRIEPIAIASHRMNLGLAWAAGAAPMITSRTWRPTPNGAVVRATVTNVGRAPMTSPATLALDGGGSTTVPVLAPGEALEFELPLPALLAAASTPRPLVRMVLRFDGVALRDSIAPIAHPVESLLADDFESGLDGWQSGRSWGTETSDDRGRVASDSPGGNYELGRMNSLTLAAPISLRGFSAAELFFDASYEVEGRNHNAAVQVRRDPTGEWEDVDAEELQLPFENARTTRNRFRGDGRPWRRYRVGLDAFLGSDVVVRFMVDAPEWTSPYRFDGLKIDDVEIVAARMVSLSAGDDARTAALAAMPNPFMSRLVVQLPEASGTASIALVDGLGRLVRSARADARIVFDTGDLPAGAYTVVVRRGGEVMRRRVTLGR